MNHPPDRARPAGAARPWNPLPAALERVVAFLESFGIEIIWSDEGPWVRCLLAGGAENAVGSGRTRDEALASALCRHFPGELAREVVARAIADFAPAALRADDEPPAAEAGAGLAPAEPAATNGRAARFAELELPSAASPIEPIAKPIAATLPVEAAEAAESHAPRAPHGATRADPAPADLSRREQPRTGEHPPAAVFAEFATAGEIPSRAPSLTLTREESLERMEELRRTYETDRDTLALLSPARQRLVLTAWTCRFRAVEEERGKDSAVNARGHELARLLTSYGKTLWPGSVNVLQKDKSPWDVIEELPSLVSTSPASWADAAELVDRVHDDLVESETAAGRDEDGWADAPRLKPAPREFRKRLQELHDLVVKQGGPFEVPGEHGPPPDPKTFLEWVRRLRWLRGWTDDPWQWGEVAGRLRYWAAKNRFELAEGRHELSSDYDPLESWAVRLGQDPAAEAYRNRVKSVLRRYPFDNDPKPPKAVLPLWLKEALGLWSTHKDWILARCRRDAAWPLRYGTEDLDLGGADHRGQRRALQILHEALREKPDLEEEQRAYEAIESTIDEEGELESAAIDPVLEALRAEVLPHTRGKRVLFVSNRKDHDLRQILEDQLELSELVWSEGKQREIQAQVQAIKQGRYDLVITATGFHGHRIDWAVGPACRQAGVPQVRANKGRLSACLLACKRDLLGVSSGS